MLLSEKIESGGKANKQPTKTMNCTPLDLLCQPV